MPPTAITVPVEQDSGAARLEAAEQRLPETLDPESLRKYFQTSLKSGLRVKISRRFNSFGAASSSLNSTPASFTPLGSFLELEPAEVEGPGGYPASWGQQSQSVSSLSELTR